MARANAWKPRVWLASFPNFTSGMSRILEKTSHFPIARPSPRPTHVAPTSAATATHRCNALSFAMPNDTINQHFSKEYKSISDVYNDSTEDDVLALKGCVLRARSLLEEPSIPRYYRIKTLLLLASMVPDPSEAQVADTSLQAHANDPVLTRHQTLFPRSGRHPLACGSRIRSEGCHVVS